MAVSRREQAGAMARTFGNAGQWAVSNVLPGVLWKTSQKLGEKIGKETVNYIKRNAAEYQTPSPKRQKTSSKRRGSSTKSSGGGRNGTGMRGYLKRRPKRRNLRQRSKKKGLADSRYGSRIVTEAGGSITAANAVYIGHSTCAQQQVGLAVWRAVIKRLFSLAGDNFVNWEEVPRHASSSGYARAIRTEYYADPANALDIINIAMAIDNTDTYAEIAEKLQVHYWNLFSSIPHVFVNFRLTESEGSITRQVSAMTVDNMKINFYIKSELRLQNATLANNTPGDDDAELTTNISSNPLERIHYLKKNCNGLELNLPLAQATVSDMYADVNSGLIAQNTTDASFADIKVLTKLPTGATFNAKSMKMPAVPSGQIITDILITQKSMNFNTFLKTFDRALGANQKTVIRFGDVSLTGFEKYLNSRENEPDIKVNWQMNQTLVCSLATKRARPTMQLVDLIN